MAFKINGSTVIPSGFTFGTKPDIENITDPRAVLVGFCGCIIAWVLLFGYSEAARHQKL